ncbi:MAG: hypothetical protein DKINENOH_04284 [bacterium]|nr:hypothetical protein [bacterium]
MNNKTFISMLAALVMIAAASPAQPCSCVPTPPPAQAFEQADAVLTGMVIDIQEGPASYSLTVRISASEVWKGKKDLTAEIITASNSAMCGFYFQKGKTYLIYAYENPEGRLATNNCTRTKLIDRAGEDLAFLTTQPGVTRRARGCGCDNILAGDIYLFAGVFVCLFRQRASRKLPCCKHLVKHNHEAKH